MERKWRLLVEEKAWAGTDMELTYYGFPLAVFTSFKYLRRVLAAEDNNWPEVVRNLRCTRQKWERLTRILSREGADSRTSGPTYFEVVQLGFICGSDTWFLAPCMKRLLGRCHHRVAHWLTGRQPQRRRDGRCVYPPLEDAMSVEVLKEVKTYIFRLQN